jgi:hypothetical protein
MKARTLVLIAAVVCAATALFFVANKYNVDNCVHDCWKDGVRIR